MVRSSIFHFPPIKPQFFFPSSFVPTVAATCSCIGRAKAVRIFCPRLEGAVDICEVVNPIGSMYGIYANIWGILMVNVTIYSIHGSYGYRMV